MKNAVEGGRRDQLPTGSTSARRATPKGSCSRLLIVEADATYGHLLAHLAARSIGEPTLVGTACAAVKQVANRTPWTALILEERLPDGSGLEVLSSLRATGSNVPALILAGLADPQGVNRAFELDSHYLVKPVAMPLIEQFLVRVERIATSDSLAVSTPGQSLPADLCELATDVLRAAARDGIAHTEYVFRLALLARAASGRTHDGRSVTESCARAVNVSRSAFQRLVAVTTRWKPSEIRVVLGRRDHHGHEVTLHHLLSTVHAPAHLRSRLETIVREGADISQLRAYSSHSDPAPIADDRAPATAPSPYEE
jgi:DNA-binding response OmpR family regulator